jgi:hypothetical protein
MADRVLREGSVCGLGRGRGENQKNLSRPTSLEQQRGRLGVEGLAAGNTFVSEGSITKAAKPPQVDFSGYLRFS